MMSLLQDVDADGQTPQQSFSTTSPGSCVSCSDFASAIAASWCGTAPCDCLRCIRWNMYSFNIKSDNVENLDVRSLKRSCLHGNIKNYNCHQQRNSAAIPGSQQQLACAMMAVQWLLFLVSP